MTLIYRAGELAHLQGANPGTPYTVCGVDAGAMKREELPAYAAAVWCSACMKAAIVGGSGHLRPERDA